MGGALTDEQILELVRQMREKQRRWFEFKNLPDLKESKRLEAEVDKALAARFSPQGGML